MKNIKFRKTKRTKVVASLAFASAFLLSYKTRAEEKVEQEKPTATVKVGTGVDLKSKTPRATAELDVKHPLPAGLGLGVNFGVASKGSFDQGTQPGLQLEQIDLTLNSPKLGPVVVSLYGQNSTHLGTILTGGGNVIADLKKLIAVVGIQKNIEGPIPIYAVLAAPIKDVVKLGIGGVKVLNGDVVGGRASAELTLPGIPGIYVDLFILGSPKAEQIVFNDLTAGLQFDF